MDGVAAARDVTAAYERSADTVNWFIVGPTDWGHGAVYSQSIRDRTEVESEATMTWGRKILLAVLLTTTVAAVSACSSMNITYPTGYHSYGDYTP